MERLERTRELLARYCAELGRGLDAAELAGRMGAARHNVSADLNQLWRDGYAVKLNGRPVLFWDPEVYRQRAAGTGGVAASGQPAPAPAYAAPGGGDPFEWLIGAQESLRSQVEQAGYNRALPRRLADQLHQPERQPDDEEHRRPGLGAGFHPLARPTALPLPPLLLPDGSEPGGQAAPVGEAGRSVLQQRCLQPDRFDLQQQGRCADGERPQQRGDRRPGAWSNWSRPTRS